MSVGRRMAGYLARESAREVAIAAAAPVTNPIADHVGPAYDGYVAASSAGGALGSMWTAGQGLRQQGEPGGRRGGGAVIVGGEWFHGGSDRKNALAQLGADFTTFRNDLVRAVASSTRGDDAAWMTADVAPTLADWTNFLARMAASSIAPYVTEWSVYESWWERLQRLRQLARARGLHLESADPQPLPETIWQRGAKGTGGPLDVWISFAKTVTLGMIGLTGIVAFYSIARDVHGRLRGRRLAA